MLVRPSSNLQVTSYGAGEWQRRRKSDKERELAIREDLLSREAEDITPSESGHFPFSGLSEEEIAEKYGYKRVKLTGMFDHAKEVRVEKERDGMVGYEILTPFYTHVNSKGEKCGLMVNRGWLVRDFENSNQHYMGPTKDTIEGVLYAGDLHQKYDAQPNTPASGQWRRVWPDNLALVSQLKNREDADKVIFKIVDFDKDHRQILPDAPTTDDFLKWENMPARHETFANFWKYATYMNIFANTAFWLAF